MKKLVWVALGFSMACNPTKKTATAAPEAVKTAVESTVYSSAITEAELKEYLYTYASDEFEGRETGEPGQKKL